MGDDELDDLITGKEEETTTEVAKVEEEPEEEEGMSFVDHLEELRWHLIRGIIAVAVFTIVAFVSKKFVYGVLILGPSKADFWTFKMLCAFGEMIGSSVLCFKSLAIKFQNVTMTGQFMMHITSSIVIGIICAFPYFFWEIWRFIKPGLYKKEQKAARGATFYVSFLFMTGVLFGYYIIAPLSIKFLTSYQLDAKIENIITIASYVSILMTLVLACGILFQLPVVVYFLAKVGLITPTFLRAHRRHSVVIILILSAVLTPPDIFSQVFIAMPLSFLYEVGIWIAVRVERQRLKELAEEEEKKTVKEEVKEG
ncbi:twin arginine-targeting protein translocase TatC [Microscilla marina ATCC 23134]|uniref:Sec-independent protein translocase protein TatC n=2 Tax=Microscilla marina TaxID=1027 RepID=A1ZVU8_MICM2|nr:twin arginine-targeting protein translocase TatC [Microscilla marina ATCC 23134]